MTTPPPTVGVEEEFGVVDGRDLRLVPMAQEILDALPAELRSLVHHELRVCQIETTSPVCGSLDEIEDAVAGLRELVAGTARARGCAILAAGTHPAGRWPEQDLTDEPGYVQLGDDYQRLADEQLLFGCHVHVGVEDPDRRIAALDRVRPWLAPILALTANSPYWEGTDTGYASYRYVLFSRWPTFTTADVLGDWAGFDELVQDLVSSGSIDSPQRLYWTVRPSHHYPTLEFRIADVCTTVDEVVMLAGLARGLVMTALDDLDAGRPAPEVRSEVLRMAEWQAARFGIEGSLLDPLTNEPRDAREAVEGLLAHVAPALERAGDLGRVSGVIDGLLAEGNGAQRQRRLRETLGSAHHLRSLRVAPDADRLADVIDLRTFARLGDEPLEQSPVRRPLEQQLGVPLHAEDPTVHGLDRLDRPVVRPAHDREAVTDPIHRLVVERVRPQGLHPEDTA